MNENIIKISRIILGLIFFIFGLNGIISFIPMPSPSPMAGALMGALAKTGYFFPMLKITEMIAGALLVLNIFVPLALILLAPIIVNIFFFHLYLEPSGMPITLFIVILEIILLRAYRERFQDILKKDT